MGPNLDLTLDRSIQANEAMMKQALKIPKELKVSGIDDDSFFKMNLN